MNPYQHSDVAVAIYKIIAKSDTGMDQMAEGTLACNIAAMLAKDFDLELQPCKED